MRSRILIVEDEKAIRETLTDLFSAEYTIKSANNGVRALEALPLYRPHLIVSDIMMPDMDGIQLLNTLKSNKEWNDIPVILLTAKGEQEDRITGLEIGADAYIAKPFDFQELSLVARNLVELKSNILNGSYTYKGEIEDTNGDTIFLKKLTDLLNERLKENKISLPMVAQYFALSESGFKSKLKRAAGKTFLDFIREFRLNKSREYLMTQQYNVTEAAQLAGFRSVAHFSDSFKKYFGVSPSNLLV
ncbi:MAG: response regulator [Cyclobacteriaceae bacterium]